MTSAGSPLLSVVPFRPLPFPCAFFPSLLLHFSFPSLILICWFLLVPLHVPQHTPYLSSSLLAVNLFLCVNGFTPVHPLGGESRLLYYTCVLCGFPYQQTLIGSPTVLVRLGITRVSTTYVPRRHNPFGVTLESL